jgi:hypothetical protein
MISVGFARVSKKRPCRICGKPTYCGFSRDEGTSICMRISAGSRRLSRNGGNIHVHTEIPFITRNQNFIGDLPAQASCDYLRQFLMALLKAEFPEASSYAGGCLVS